MIKRSSYLLVHIMNPFAGIYPGFPASFLACRLIQLARRQGLPYFLFTPSICLAAGLFFIPKKRGKK